MIQATLSSDTKQTLKHPSIALYDVSSQNGTTLIELLITLGLISFISLTGIYHLTKIHNEQGAKYIAKGLKQSLHHARSTSNSSNQTRSFCLTQNLYTCEDKGHSWISFNDKDNNRARDTENEPLLASRNWQSSQVMVSSSFKDGLVTFRPNGFGRASAGSYYVCVPNTPDAYKISVSLIGKVRLERLTLSHKHTEKFCS